jgi:hypothetical protein
LRAPHGFHHFLAELRQFFALGLRHSDRSTANNQFFEGPPDLEQLQLMLDADTADQSPASSAHFHKTDWRRPSSGGSPNNAVSHRDIGVAVLGGNGGEANLSSIIIHIQLLISADHVFSISLTTGSGIGM